MVQKGTHKDPAGRLLGRLLVALMKGTGARLSANDVEILGPLFMEIARGRRARPVGVRRKKAR
jgi:hypothetical protein